MNEQTTIIPTLPVNQQPQTLSIQVLTNATPSLIQSRPHLFGLV